MRDPKLAHILVCLMASDSARREDHFQKKICPKRTFPSNVVKIGLKNTLFISGRKMVVCCFVVLLFCCFVVLLFCCFDVLLFVATLSDFGLLFFLIEALIELRKML